MKFTHGYWQMRPGVTPYYPAQVQEVKADANSLTVYAPTRPIHHRGDTLNLALLAVRFSSPMPNIIRVQLSHHQGGRPRKPEFELKAQEPPEVWVQDNAQAATLASGDGVSQ